MLRLPSCTQRIILGETPRRHIKKSRHAMAMCWCMLWPSTMLEPKCSGAEMIVDTVHHMDTEQGHLGGFFPHEGDEPMWTAILR